MKHKLLLLYSWFIRSLLFFMPDMPITMRFRGWLYSFGMKSCGKNFQVTNDAWLKMLEHISVGDNVFIGNNSMLLGGGFIYINSNVQIAPHCVLVTGNHIFRNGYFEKKECARGNIVIGKGSWIAANCTIAKCSVLPEGSVLSANSFLNKSFETKNSIYGGLPAKFIRQL